MRGVRWARRALACWGALVVAVAAAGEEIASFDVDVHLERDGHFTVLERIVYDFETEQRRGIYRDIPVRYERDWQRDYDLRLRVLGVTDEHGSERTKRVTQEGAWVRIRIGDADRTVTGVHEYRIRYRVERGVVFHDDYDELYWNVTGDGWNVPIRAAHARVHLPGGGEAGDVRTRCFTGARGSTASSCTIEAGRGSFAFATASLGASEGLTVALSLPKGVIREPGAFASAWMRFSDWGGLWLFSPLLALLGMRRVWQSRGRDFGGRDAVAVRYEPPEDLTPAEVGTLVDESADMEDVTATLIDLAARGYLDIEEVETTQLLFFTDRDYRFRKKKDADPTLRAHERSLHASLFRTGDEVSLSSLKNKFYEEIPRLKDQLYAALSGRGGHFSASPVGVRRRWWIAAGVLGAGAVLVWNVLGLPTLGGVALVSCAAIVGAFAPHMPRRTRKGRRAYEEILGYQEFLSRVDADRLERMGGRSRGQFERGLPYAIVLGVADAWADAFADLYTEPPDWYRSQRYRGGFGPRVFVNDLGTSLRTIEQTFASQPSGSGSTGFSAGGAFGGGGFSGGGFGGGGGGSW